MRLLVPAVALAFVMLTAPGLGIATDGQAQPETSVDDRETNAVTFYGSIFGHGLFEPMPMNTIYPYGENNYGVGYLANCGPGPALVDCEEASWNKIALYSTPGPVPVDNREQFAQQGGWAQLHNERGQLTDIRLDTEENVKAGIYFTYSMHGWPSAWANDYGTNCIHHHPKNVPCLWPAWRWHPGAFEDVVMEATLYAADLGEMHANASQIPPVEEAIQNGQAREIAHGQWGPDTVITGLPDYPYAAHAQIDLGPPQSETIEETEDFILVFSSHMETGGQEYNYGSPLRWYSGEFYPPTLELPVKNAITVERVIPHFAHGKLAMVSVVSMPWGSYDVAGEDIEFDVQGPRGDPVTLDSDHVSTLPIQQSLAHGGHYQPVNKTLVWDYRQAGLDAGDYQVTVTATNLQGSATHECTASFTLGEQEGRLVPTEVTSGLCGEQNLGQEDLEEVIGEATEEE